MTQVKTFGKGTPSLTLKENLSEDQSQTHWSGNYGKFLVQLLNMQAMDLSRSTISSPTLLVRLANLLSKSMEIIGTKTNPSKKPCGESIDLKDTDGE